MTLRKEKPQVAQTHEEHVIPLILRELGAAVVGAIIFGCLLTIAVAPLIGRHP